MAWKHFREYLNIVFPYKDLSWNIFFCHPLKVVLFTSPAMVPSLKARCLRKHVGEVSTLLRACRKMVPLGGGGGWAAHPDRLVVWLSLKAAVKCLISSVPLYLWWVPGCSGSICQVHVTIKYSPQTSECKMLVEQENKSLLSTYQVGNYVPMLL